MIDIQKTAKEIGHFETAINLYRVKDSADVIQKVGTSMPLPDGDIDKKAAEVARWLLEFGKSKYMFLTPEIALIEKMRRESAGNVEIIVTMPCDMDYESRERLKNNLPKGIKVTLLEEPFFPQSFFPGNGMVVICGYMGGERPMILPDTYRMVEHYSGFLGKKVFVPYMELETAKRYDGWMELNQQRIYEKWRCQNE